MTTALVIGLDVELVDACAAALGRDGHTVESVRLEAPIDPAVAGAAFDDVEARSGPVGVVVTVPGPPQPTPLMRSTDATLGDFLDLELAWQQAVVRRAGEAMARRRSGRLVLLSSVGAFTGAALESAYGAAMAGVVGYTRAVARELAPRQVTVNCVLAGPLASLRERTASSKRLDAHLDDIVRRTPGGRLCEPADVAEVVAFLASDDAGFMTGTLFPVDGGLSMGLG